MPNKISTAIGNIMNRIKYQMSRKNLKRTIINSAAAREQIHFVVYRDLYTIVELRLNLSFEEKKFFGVIWGLFFQDYSLAIHKNSQKFTNIHKNLHTRVSRVFPPRCEFS